jgi:hypothetical protein
MGSKESKEAVAEPLPKLTMEEKMDARLAIVIETFNKCINTQRDLAVFGVVIHTHGHHQLLDIDHSTILQQWQYTSDMNVGGDNVHRFLDAEEVRNRLIQYYAAHGFNTQVTMTKGKIKGCTYDVRTFTFTWTLTSANDWRPYPLPSAPPAAS